MIILLRQTESVGDHGNQIETQFGTPLQITVGPLLIESKDNYLIDDNLLKLKQGIEQSLQTNFQVKIPFPSKIRGIGLFVITPQLDTKLNIINGTISKFRIEPIRENAKVF
jgi:hypothetical protein